jgi:hypothetical protein
MFAYLLATNPFAQPIVLIAHTVPKLPVLTAPVVRRATGFHIDHCLGVTADKLPHVLRAYGFICQYLIVFVKDGHLRDIFCQIDRDGGGIVTHLDPLTGW